MKYRGKHSLKLLGGAWTAKLTASGTVLAQVHLRVVVKGGAHVGFELAPR